MEKCMPPRKKIRKSLDESFCKASNADNYNVVDDHKIILLMRENEIRTLEGIGTIQCLHGNVEMYGSKLNPKSKPCKFYSFSHHRLLSLKALKSEGKPNSSEICNKLKTLDVSSAKIKFIKDKLKSFDFVVALISREPTTIDFSLLNDCERFSYLTQPQNVQVHDETEKAITFPDEYLNVCSDWENSLQKGSTPILLLCGGKNMGKSTLARYFLNRTLNSQERVGFMECDVGQTEFIPPGCVGLNIITEPVLGPPYCHQQKPEVMAFVGLTNTKFNPSHYLDSIKTVMEAYRRNHSNLPLVVNTMGWSRNLGVSILAELVEIVKPTMLVQLNGPLSRDNFPDMSPDFVLDLMDGLTDFYSFRKQSEKVELLQYSWHPLQIPFTHTSSYSSNVTAADYRCLSLMSYFTNESIASDIDHPDQYDPTLNVSLYTFNFDKLALHSCHLDLPKHLLLEVFNKNLCSLFVVDDDLIEEPDVGGFPKSLKETPKCESLGLGFVQSISMERRTFDVITNISPSLIKDVNCFVVGMVDVLKMMLNCNEHKPSIGLPYLDYSLNSFGVAPHKPKGQCVSRLRGKESQTKK